MSELRTAEKGLPEDPPGIDPQTRDLPSADDARERVVAFLCWYGDGRVVVDTDEQGPPLYARDLEALTRVTPSGSSDAYQAGQRDLAAKVEAAQAVRLERERELLELKGPCSTEACHLHYAHAGPCDVAR